MSSSLTGRTILGDLVQLVERLLCTQEVVGSTPTFSTTFLNNMIYLAHKIELHPNNKQRTYFSKSFGVARLAYNWALDMWQKQYQAHKDNPELPKPSEAELSKLFNKIKREQYPFVMEVTKCAPQQAIRNLGIAFKRFFDGKGQYPRFHRKGVNDSFYLSNDAIKLNETRDKIYIPKLGWVRMAERLRFTGKIMSATVSRVADKWFVSISVGISVVPKQTENQSPIGVDLGVSALATTSDGEVFTGSKPLRLLQKQLRRLSKSLSRKIKKSKNWFKAKTKLARLHARIANIRKDCLHKLTTYLVKNYGLIAIEDLNVKGMLANHKLARAIVDMGFHEFKRQLSYKAAMHGVKLVVVDRWFPSSKLCSCCGHKMENMPLSVRQWQCPQCFTTHDRDVNAACNLRDYAVHAVSSTV